MTFLSIFTLQMLFTFFPSTFATQPCKSASSTYGFILVGHIFKYFASENLLLCYTACKADPSCQSLNYNLADNICEFNSEFKRSRPEHFQKRNMYVYAENPDRGKKGSMATVPGQSCKDIKDSGDFDTSGTYWIRPEGSRVSFQGYCDMSAVGQWTRVTQSRIDNTLKGGVTLTYSEENNGLVISGQMTLYGCASVQPGLLTYIKGYWTKIKYTQEFRGRSACWSIFGDIHYGRESVNNVQTTGLYAFNASQGDSITNEHYMGGNSHAFDGKTTKCENTGTNFWYNTSPSVRYATVVLRRQLTAEKAGIYTGTSCGTPTFKIKDIYVYF